MRNREDFSGLALTIGIIMIFMGGLASGFTLGTSSFNPLTQQLITEQNSSYDSPSYSSVVISEYC